MSRGYIFINKKAYPLYLLIIYPTSVSPKSFYYHA